MLISRDADLVKAVAERPLFGVLVIDQRPAIRAAIAGRVPQLRECLLNAGFNHRHSGVPAFGAPRHLPFAAAQTNDADKNHPEHERGNERQNDNVPLIAATVVRGTTWNYRVNAHVVSE